MTLSKAFNKHSNEWREIKAILEDRRERLVASLVSLNNEEIRGRIKEIEETLSLDKQESEPPPQPLEY